MSSPRRPLVLPDIEPATQLLPVVPQHGVPEPRVKFDDYLAELPEPVEVSRRRDPLVWAAAALPVLALLAILLMMFL
ncbi:hypothetical protein GCM10010472_71890 [Pseudonocardia halophobica]|uniref:Uncharacterized protein n=1 Tax=Pseudonocardia halophobica TaxID=29401 RepID=A0A9W6L2A8_9PSEU|nr:hypothetical protein [Pseudonocardia halophobica]GLL10939.1 hypothetical protein GCM10017577_20800 [Pseudonocardia halophobica]